MSPVQSIRSVPSECLLNIILLMVAHQNVSFGNVCFYLCPANIEDNVDPILAWEKAICVIYHVTRAMSALAIGIARSLLYTQHQKKLVVFICYEHLGTAVGDKTSSEIASPDLTSRKSL